MVEAVAAVVQLAGFAFASSKALHQTIESFRNSSTSLRNLKDEVNLLSNSLASLKAIVNDPDTDFAPLELPLKTCGDTCREFEKLILKVAPSREEDRRTFRGWIRLQYKGEDIRTFRETLGTYRSIVCIAIGDANLRSLVVTRKVLQDYKEMIAETTGRLEERLERLDDLDAVAASEISVSRSILASTSDGSILRERDSTKQCLVICSQVSQHIATVQSAVFENLRIPPDVDATPITTLIGLVSAHQATSDALKACERTMNRTEGLLQRNLDDLDSELSSERSSSSSASSRPSFERNDLEADIASTRQTLKLMAEKAERAESPSINIYENLELADDCHTVIVSNIGQLISARHISAGARSTQWMGQMSDESIQALAKSLPPRTAVTIADAQAGAVRPDFEGRYGVGTKLSSRDHKGKGGFSH